MLKRAIVIGGSSGIGAALVRRLAEEGWLVAAVSRRQDALDAVCGPLNSEGRVRARAYAHDVTDTEAVPALFERIVQDLDGLDLLVYAAGVMPHIDEDTYDTAIDKQIVDVNVTGAMAWCNPAAERFAVQGEGILVGIGSVAGDRGRRGNPAYCASKAALHTYLEALRNRLSEKGVTVLTVKPGPVHTPMTEGLDGLPMAIAAEDAADGIWSAIRARSMVRYVPRQWAPIMGVIRSIPSVVFRRMKI